MIEIRNLSKSYDDKEVFKDYDLRLKDGGLYVLSGASGAGKTTLLRLISGLEKPDKGEIVFSGDLSDHGIPGVVFQEDRLCEDFNAVENVMMACKGITEREASEELLMLLQKDCLNKPVKDLSGGQKRRVALIRALAKERDYYLLDEPLNALDKENVEKVIDYILKKRKGKLMIIASHNMEKPDGCEIIHI
ncbi:MAG: ATP-binding cassette domain-containing protein [Lachnospiraceae bacterium]|nr:ATP-binding cassette domain-containing protein [Lachnospiraceae bacterium]